MQLSMPRFDQGSVLVVGDVMLDRYWQGDTGRVSPEAPVPVVNVQATDDRPGGASNVAMNIAALGAAANLAGLVGNDDAAASLLDSLSSVGVNCLFTTVADKPTITKLRVVSRQQQLLRMDFEKPFSEQDSASLSHSLSLDGVQVLLLSDYAKGSLQHCQSLIASARKKKIPVLVDPKGHDFERYRGATLLTPNLSEFEAVVGSCQSEAELVSKGQDLLNNLELDALLITRGEQGMTLLQANKEGELHLPAKAREVFDVTGAGDTVIAVLAASIAAGSDLPMAVGLANVAAGMVVAKLGTATISAPELRQAVAAGQEVECGVVNEEQLVLSLQAARARGEKLVFTNGCFDILHAGHVGYLADARELGNRLIVAINSDESVSRLKGPSRPINPVDRRMAVLAGLSAVDWVLSFPDDTPERLLELIQPDVLVKGGDYSEEQVVGWEIVKGYGGEVKVLSFFDNCSTTAIVEKVIADADKPA
ncbi:bifunctional D-glycero-beta-D-manno-heptose-7-phosphate kinase/D-glycero-beta-D-manno-heptose 1-phosphate adenylyltransferase HldE [Pseudoteredinibacter isoporae]|uniref:Bifunctional protein HldE n=1 Tax=Pseudoteredinibacter isoporae TaxID=570281 RepID=A0A7X0JSJ2_9GAMM|nr:bifunctional D-glycero-beta-D-manno-heptose-7-phosphate kinase/D-glycero-beta-D-manno-heptose 1-phosphate adenylyltransferase HldE [Pseudoteredinibacter isoporae]MBB6520615.1 D-beta-D-heptose 7-phosphate kinase/D-beta-D-heptose 1-phosphate adenosyltransferase [Pseudoteredinibacter isoporae]NHO86182.1 bifunctional D-glycero-beta-D-manno-heptose-7-phosphate kinase/D-glycero-beta-D-manno-heptose 1-phosphate adenylyltransferase HldE [Pseudoteredinibacter isoporae]NIB25367.1 bifunctional D-glycero